MKENTAKRGRERERDFINLATKVTRLNYYCIHDTICMVEHIPIIKKVYKIAEQKKGRHGRSQEHVSDYFKIYLPRKTNSSSSGGGESRELSERER